MCVAGHQGGRRPTVQINSVLAADKKERPVVILLQCSATGRASRWSRTSHFARDGPLAIHCGPDHVPGRVAEKKFAHHCQTW